MIVLNYYKISLIMVMGVQSGGRISLYSIL